MSPDTDLTGVMLPADAEAARDLLVKRTQETGRQPFWVANKPRRIWGDRRPEGTRNCEHVAKIYMPTELLEIGKVELRYKDGYRLHVLLTDLARGKTLLPGEISERWCPVGPEEYDLTRGWHE